MVMYKTSYKTHKPVYKLENLNESQLDVFCPQAIIVHCYLKFKLRNLKNLKPFSIRVKELFDTIVLPKAFS